ncbi:MAG TPA: hypothetical protein VK928_04200 [Longimicrobiales bacterium]|nr:hypothetical protein [Longimicrobiales bacterium]
MIRRDVLKERDGSVVKWSLVAAAFALSLGCYAEMVLASHEEPTPSVQTVQQTPQVPTAALAG